MLDTRTNKKRCDVAMHVYNEGSNNKPTHKLQVFSICKVIGVLIWERERNSQVQIQTQIKGMNNICI